MLVSALMAALFVIGGCGRQSTEQPAPPADGQDAAFRVVNPADAPAAEPAAQIVGSVGCRQCHQKFYELWAPSHHGLAMQPYSSDFAAANLKPQADFIEIGSRRYRAEIGPDEGWVVERGPSGERKLPMVHVLGGKNVYYFLTPWERGRLQTLPVAYDVHQQTWYDTAQSGVRHFPGSAQRADDAPLHWTDRQFTFNTSCYSCHVSQLAANYDLKTDAYHTTWAEPGINCEVCHGPGAAHVQVCRAAEEGVVPDDLKIIITATFDAEQTNAMCAPCHAKMEPLTTTFRPGDRLFDHYNLITLEHPDFYPDGRDLGENYTMTSWRMSPCAQSGKLDCVHCHTSSGRFRFADNPNASCLPCHASRVDNAAAHRHHLPESPGNLCINCHMPKTRFALMTRSDHSMRPPTPATTLLHQSPNACNLCHTDQDAAWADQAVRQWHSDDYQAPALYRAGLVDEARKGDWTRLPDMLVYLSGSDRDEVTATGLIRLLRTCPDSRKWPAITQALHDTSPLVRAAAAETLSGHLTPETLPALLQRTADEFRLVRVRAAAALAPALAALPPGPQRQSLERATDEFLEAMRARPDDYGSYHNLGLFYAERGELDRALEAYETASRLEPRMIAPLINASLLHNQLGQNDRAEQCLREALRIEPTSAAANLNLGMLLGELGRRSEAEQAFREALKADPESAPAAYNLGVLIADRDVRQAIGLCRTASRLRPEEPKYALGVAFYLQQAGEIDQATGQLRKMLVDHPDFVSTYALLGSLLVRQGRTAEAIEVFRQAAGNESLPPAVRERFEARARALDSPSSSAERENP